MKKIYSLLAAACVALSVSAADPVVVIDANFEDIDNSAWTSENNNWDWDQTEKDTDGNWVPYNIFAQGQTITINFECWIDDVKANFEGDSVVVFAGWFKMSDASGGDVWAFQDIETFNKPFPNITDWSGTDSYDYELTFPADMATTADAQATTTSDTPDADFYMLQIKGYKDGAIYGPGNVNMNFILKGEVSADDVAADAAVVYPNPVAAGAVVTIEGEFTVANVAGAIVAAGADELDTSDLNAGIYFVSVANEVIKLVVE